METTTEQNNAAQILADFRKNQTYIRCGVYDGYEKSGPICLVAALVCWAWVFIPDDTGRAPLILATIFSTATVLSFGKALFYLFVEFTEKDNPVFWALSVFNARAIARDVVEREFGPRTVFAQAFYDFLTDWLEGGQPTELWRLKCTNETRSRLARQTYSLRLIIYLLIQSEGHTHITKDCDGFLSGGWRFTAVKDGIDYYFDWSIGKNGCDEIAIGKYRLDNKRDIRLFRDTLTEP